MQRGQHSLYYRCSGAIALEILGQETSPDRSGWEQGWMRMDGADFLPLTRCNATRCPAEDKYQEDTFTFTGLNLCAHRCMHKQLPSVHYYLRLTASYHLIPSAPGSTGRTAGTQQRAVPSPGGTDPLWGHMTLPGPGEHGGDISHYTRSTRHLCFDFTLLIHPVLPKILPWACHHGI